MSFVKHNMLVDVVSAKNEAIGVSLRGQLLDQGKNFRTAHVLVFTRTGSLILQKLPKDHIRSPAKLGSSVAGYLIAGEDYAQAARRKMKDELRIDEDLRYIGTLEMRDEESLKFIGIFICEHNKTIKNYDERQIASIVYHRMEWIEAALKKTPTKFTATFLQVFKAYQRYVGTSDSQGHPFEGV